MGARTASMRVGAAAALCLALAGVSPAAAQSTIGQAEEAYMNVDFERTRELCQQALREGGHSPEQLARIEVVWFFARSAQLVAPTRSTVIQPMATKALVSTPAAAGWFRAAGDSAQWMLHAAAS